jgi:hypothetical protein
MGKIKNNVVTKGFSGKFGDDLVFRQVDNQTIFAKRTLTPSSSTARQTEVRNKFAEAANYASNAIDNPQAGLDYKLMAELQGLKSAYLAAVTDYLTMPEILGVFANAYKGTIGDILNIKPKAPFKIIDMDVTITGANGVVIESGKAVSSQLKWKYTVTKVNANVVGTKLKFVARDRQGKTSTYEQTL